MQAEARDLCPVRVAAKRPNAVSAHRPCTRSIGATQSGGAGCTIATNVVPIRKTGRVLVMQSSAKATPVTDRIREICDEWAADLPVGVPWLEEWAASTLLAWHKRGVPGARSHNDGCWGMWWPMLHQGLADRFGTAGSKCLLGWEIDLEMAALRRACVAGRFRDSLATRGLSEKRQAMFPGAYGAILELLDLSVSEGGIQNQAAGDQDPTLGKIRKEAPRPRRVPCLCWRRA